MKLSAIKGLFAVVLWTLLATAASGNASSGRDTSLSAIREVLRGPVEVELSNGVRYNGRIERFDGEALDLAVAASNRGEAIFTFEKEQIRTLRFPGEIYRKTLARWMEDNERTADALALFRAFYEQQARYLDLLPESALGLFVEYARFALRNNQPVIAVAMAEEIRPRLQSASTRQRLDDALVLGFLRVGLKDEAAEAARAWIREADPAGNTAMGWRVLAEIHMDNELFEDALWIALQPIAYAGAMPMEHLAACYAIAILAAMEIRLPDVPGRLYLEMLERNLTWPDAPEWIASNEPQHFAEPLALPEEEEDLADALLEEEEPPRQTPSPVDPMESLPTRIYF